MVYSMKAEAVEIRISIMERRTGADISVSKGMRPPLYGA
jgi:hypothetical protein